MESLEIKKELNMSYFELVAYLLKKYGTAKYDYYCNESCKSKNRKVARTDEGLYCHHIDENKAFLLSNEKFAAIFPYTYQKADRLVYCNVLEHLILHIKIFEENPILGVSGAVVRICPQINDYFNGYHFKQPYLINIYSMIENNYNDYIEILKYFLNLLEERNLNETLFTKEELSRGYNRQIVEKIYNEL